MPKFIALLLVSAALANAQMSAKPEEVEARFRLLESRILQLEAELAAVKGTENPVAAPEQTAIARPAPASVQEPQSLPMAEVIPTAGANSGDLASREQRMPLSGYMDYHLNKRDGEPATGDFHRFVLLFGHSFNRRIQFWSELELEHSFVAGGEESGELELEQAYLDFLVHPQLSVRSGIMLAPMGLINERHEPPSFNGVERPFVDTVILPTTWFGPGAGVHGDLGRGFTYKAYVMDPLNSSQFNAEEGFRNGRQKAFESVMQNPALTGRLEYHGLPGLSLGASFWTGKTGFATPGINPRATIFEFDGRGSLGRFDFRGEFARTHLDQTAALNSLLQRTSGANPNIAERMRGFYAEGAYHLLPARCRHDMVVFSRYENFDTQYKMADGFLPLGAFDRDAFVTGFTFFPDPDVALKLDYTILRNQSNFIAARNGLNLGIGWWF
jgi:hypothetical protein